MKNQLFRASLFLAITAVVFCVRAFPQEVREEEKNEAEKTPEERERDKRTEDVLSGRAFLLSSDSMSRDIKRNMLRMKPNFNPTTFVTFGSGRGFNRKIAFKKTTDIHFLMFQAWIILALRIATQTGICSFFSGM